MSAPATKPDAAKALADTIDKLVRQERNRNQFIDRVFQAGRDLGLDDESIRRAALSAFHRHYDPPPLPRAPVSSPRPPMATRDDDLRTALTYLEQNLDRKLPVVRRIQGFWATAKASRSLGSDEVLVTEFMKLALRSGLVSDLGRHGREDAEHVLSWALKGWNPFAKAPLK
jgi:hypothetical protein